MTDPLVCTRCGKRMSIVGFVTDAVAIGRILDQLGLSSSEAEKPPAVPEILRAAEHGDDPQGRRRVLRASSSTQPSLRLLRSLR